MYAFIMLSAAAFAMAQPLPTSHEFVGPIQNVMPAVEAARTEEIAAHYRMANAMRLDLSNVSDGAQLKVKGAGLKLKMPM